MKNTRSNPHIILAPRITEKGTITVSSANAYVFNVAREATKFTIAAEVARIYNVTPVKVNVVNRKAQVINRRGKVGSTGGIKKAYVYLKKGDSIAII